MRKIVLAMFVSLDGYIEGPQGLIPPAWSADLQEHWSDANLAMANAVLYGRASYEDMASYWQSPGADPAISKKLASLPKYVLSSSLQQVSWANTSILRNIESSLAELKSQPGGDVVAFGGANLARNLMKRDLVDEFRLMVTPDVFGGGKSLFAGNDIRLRLAMLSSRAMDTGAVILHYRRVTQA